MTFKFMFVVMVFVFITRIEPVAACPDWYAKIVDHKPAMWDEQLNLKDIQVVDDPLGLKGKVTKFRITDKSESSKGQTRVELAHQACNSDEGDTTYIAWEFFLEKPFNTANDIAYWESNNSHTQTMGFSITPGGMHNLNKNIMRFFTLLPGRRVHWQHPIKLGVWHQLAMEIRWSESAEQGEVSLWFDKTKVVDNIKLASKADPNRVSIHLGLRRQQGEMTDDSIYISNAFEGQTIKELLD